MITSVFNSCQQCKLSFEHSIKIKIWTQEHDLRKYHSFSFCLSVKRFCSRLPPELQSPIAYRLQEQDRPLERERKRMREGEWESETDTEIQCSVGTKSRFYNSSFGLNTCELGATVHTRPTHFIAFWHAWWMDLF